MENSYIKTPQQEALKVLGEWRKDLEMIFIVQMDFARCHLQNLRNLILVAIGGWNIKLTINRQNGEARETIKKIELAESHLRTDQVELAILVIDQLRIEGITSTFLLTPVGVFFLENQTTEKLQKMKEKLKNLSAK